ncbi:MAG: IS200/IS605 family transposase [Acidobacteriota bacterium]|nr:IS200/IS605 family transposase [Acidobacteriota bacterium]
MAQTLTSLLVHVVFSTKHRADLLTPEVEPMLFAYIGGILKNEKSVLLASGGTMNHVHLLISQSKNIALSDLLKEVKQSSSKWIKTQGKEFSDFQWQDGYGAFTIGKSQVETIRNYFANQKIHHQKQDFQDELREVSKRYDLEYDERYLWD